MVQPRVSGFALVHTNTPLALMVGVDHSLTKDGHEFHSSYSIILVEIRRLQGSLPPF